MADLERALKCADDIINDLTDRKGLRHEWDNIDEDIQNEIRDTWAEIIDRCYQDRDNVK